jgi:hypothetical protein
MRQNNGKMRTTLIKALRAIRGEMKRFSIDIISLTGNAQQRTFARRTMRWMERFSIDIIPPIGKCATKSICPQGNEMDGTVLY